MVIRTAVVLFLEALGGVHADRRDTGAGAELSSPRAGRGEWAAADLPLL